MCQTGGQREPTHFSPRPGPAAVRGPSREGRCTWSTLEAIVTKAACTFSSDPFTVRACSEVPGK